MSWFVMVDHVTFLVAVISRYELSDVFAARSTHVMHCLAALFCLPSSTASWMPFGVILRSVFRRRFAAKV